MNQALCRIIKYNVIVLTVISCLISFAPLAVGADAFHNWSHTEELVHGVVGFGISFLAYNVYKKATKIDTIPAKIAAFLTTVAIGTIKELASDEFSGSNLGSAAVGGALGAVLAFEF